MHLSFNESVLIAEGEMEDICVIVSDERERDIHVSFTVIPINNNSGISVYQIYMHVYMSLYLLYTRSCE